MFGKDWWDFFQSRADAMSHNLAIAQWTTCICTWWSMKVLMFRNGGEETEAHVADGGDPSSSTPKSLITHSQRNLLIGHLNQGAGQYLISCLFFNLGIVASTCVLYCNREQEANTLLICPTEAALHYTCCPVEFQVEAPPPTFVDAGLARLWEKNPTTRRPCSRWVVLRAFDFGLLSWCCELGQENNHKACLQ